MSDERVALVTGCRSGFGLLSAVALARRGFTVYAGLRDLGTAGELVAAGAGLPLTPVQLDVVDADQRAEAVSRILARHGRIDALVNNAGIAIGGFHELLSEEDLRGVMEVNLFAVWALTNLVLPGMRARGGGTIINVSSMSGRMAMPGLGAYSASKFALEGLSEALRHELRPFGIRVALVEPGPFKTDIFGRNLRVAAATGDAAPAYAARAAHVEALALRFAARGGDPQEVATLIADLCEAPDCALRHPIGPGTGLRLLLTRILPFGLWERVLGWVTMPRA